ncbi:hypothetical protein D3C87_2167820 [compost metagenome]
MCKASRPYSAQVSMLCSHTVVATRAGSAETSRGNSRLVKGTGTARPFALTTTQPTRHDAKMNA